LLDPAQFLKPVPPQLFKHGLHGEKVAEDAFDFEWPTKEEWEQMNHSEPINLKEIKVTQCNEYIDGVTHQPIKISIHLSNGMKSQDFTASYAGDKIEERTFSFD